MADGQTAVQTTTGRRTTPPFRADHVGSLLRPPSLLEARAAFEAGRIDADALRAVEDEAIRDAVAMQREVGLQSATDGEFRRATWHMDFIYQLGGVEHAAGDMKVQFRNEAGNRRVDPGGPAHRRRRCTSTTRSSPRRSSS